ncbi:hypothetical protein GQ457_04G031640 [Hibiscus cannabinus]
MFFIKTSEKQEGPTSVSNTSNGTMPALNVFSEKSLEKQNEVKGGIAEAAQFIQLDDSIFYIWVGSYQHVEYIMAYKDFGGFIDEGSIICFENAAKRKHWLERIEDAHNEVKAMQENPKGSTSSSVVPSTDDKKADDLDMDHARAT